MNSINGFKSIADEIMSGISASDTLKAKTMGRLKRTRAVLRLSLSAASAAVLLLVLSLTVFRPGAGSDLPGVLSATDAASPYAAVTAPITLSGAEEEFGERFLKPDYTPAGFSLESVSVSGEEEYRAAVLSFSDGKWSYAITEEKAQSTLGFEGYKSTDINGRQGYVKSEDGELPYTEVHWTEEGVRCAVTGSISEEEALKVARSMK